MVNGQPSSSDMKKHEELGENKDELVRPPKIKKNAPSRSPKPNIEGANTEFKPWDDKPDACLAQQDKFGSRGSRKNMHSKVN